MKLFNSIAYDAIYGKLVFLFFFCIAIAIIPRLFLVFGGAFFVLGLFKTAMEIDDFQCRYAKPIKALDSISNINLDGKAIKKDGKWL